MPVGVQVEARRAPNYGPHLVARLGARSVVGAAVTVLVIRAVVALALVLRALVALVALVLGTLLVLLVRLLIVLGLSALGLLVIFDVGVVGISLALGLFLLVRLLVFLVRLLVFLVRLLLDVGVALGLVVLVVVEVVILDQAAVREPIANPVGHVADRVGDTGHLAERRQGVELAHLWRHDAGRGDERRSRGDRLDSTVAGPVGLVVVAALECRLDRGGDHMTHVNRPLVTPSLAPSEWAIRPSPQEREPLFFRVEPDRLPLLRPFDDE